MTEVEQPVLQSTPAQAAKIPELIEVSLPVGAVLAQLRRQGRCPAIPQVAIVRSGTLAVRSPDGRDEHFSAGNVIFLGPDRDAWTIGQQQCVLAGFAPVK